jgi:hypothetical protein
MRPFDNRKLKKVFGPKKKKVKERWTNYIDRRFMTCLIFSSSWSLNKGREERDV